MDGNVLEQYPVQQLSNRAMSCEELELWQLQGTDDSNVLWLGMAGEICANS